MPKGIYVLQEKPGGKFYVGKSNDIHARIQEHKEGLGTTCCHMSSSSQQLEPITPPIFCNGEYDLESWERVETLTRMYEYGIENVRGWLFTAPQLSSRDKDMAFMQICERFDLCRRCGHGTHYANNCHSRQRVVWGERFMPYAAT